MTQRGFSSILLIVIIVSLAGMTTVALRFVAGTQGAAGVQTQSMRAKRAAEAAIEWQRYRLKSGTCSATANVNIPTGTGTFQVTTKCASTSTANEAGKVINTYLLTSTACWPAGPGGVCPNPAPVADYVVRSVTVHAACSTAPISCTW